LNVFVGAYFGYDPCYHYKNPKGIVLYQFCSQQIHPTPFAYCPSHNKSPCDEAIEVLLKSKAYVVKRLDASDPSGSDGQSQKEKLGQVTWSKFGGPTKAWNVAATRAGFR